MKIFTFCLNKKALVSFIGLFILCVITFSGTAFAQNVVVSDDPGATADASAVLDVQSDTKGILVPRLTTAQRLAVASPASGLLLFDTDTNTFWFHTDGSGWTELVAVGTPSTPSFIADADDDTKVQAEESGDEDVIRFDTQGSQRMVITDNGRIGINESNPSAMLEVEDPGLGGNDMFRVGISGVTDARLIVDTAGNVGVKTNNPVNGMDIQTSLGLRFRWVDFEGALFDGFNNDDQVVYINAVNNFVSVALPPAADNIGRVLRIIKTGVNDINIANADGISGFDSTFSGLGIVGMTVQSDGTDWFPIATTIAP